MKNLIASVFVLFISYSCSTTKTYVIQPKSNSGISGKVTFTEKNNQVEMKILVNNISEGEHAIHIHEKADCSAADGSSAGGHWNPTQDLHGKWAMGHHHMGDIGNLIANANKEAQLVFKTDKWCLTCTDPTKNLIGKGLIIHESVDDFTTQPTGNAGGRIGCVEIK